MVEIFFSENREDDYPIDGAHKELPVDSAWIGSLVGELEGPCLVRYTVSD